MFSASQLDITQRLGRLSMLSLRTHSSSPRVLLPTVSCGTRYPRSPYRVGVDRIAQQILHWGTGCQERSGRSRSGYSGNDCGSQIRSRGHRLGSESDGVTLSLRSLCLVVGDPDSSIRFYSGISVNLYKNVVHCNSPPRASHTRNATPQGPTRATVRRTA